MALAPVASENHAGHLARSQFVDRTTRDGDLLVPGAQFPPQVCDPSHFTLPIAPWLQVPSISRSFRAISAGS